MKGVLIGAVIASLATVSTGLAATPEVTFKVGKHEQLNASAFTLTSAGYKLGEASKLYTDDDGGNCNDVPFCVTFKTDGTDHDQWSFDHPSYIDITEDDAGSLCADQDYDVNIFVVRTFANGISTVGYTPAPGTFKCVIAAIDHTNTSAENPAWVWAHEIGHMFNMSHHTCTNAIMYSNADAPPTPLTDLNALTQTDYDIMLNALIAGGDELACSAITPAGIVGCEALVTGGGVDISFETLWESEVASFSLDHLVDSTGASDYSLTNLTKIGTSNGFRYSTTDASGGSGDAYRIVEHRTGGLADLSYGPVIAETTTPNTQPNYDVDSLVAAVTAFDDPQLEVLAEPCNTMYAPLYSILCPDSMVGAMRSYASLWRYRANVIANVVPYSVTESCFGGYRGYIQWAAARGGQYFVLVGDANDAVMWDTRTARRQPESQRAAFWREERWRRNR